MENTVNRTDIIGMKQVLRALEADMLQTVYIAEDAEPHIRERILAQCALHGTETRTVSTMKELGKACGIEVGAACAGIRRA